MGTILSYYNDLADDMIESMKQEEGQEYQVLDHGFVRCVEWMGSDRFIVDAARVSYMSHGKTEEEDKRLLLRLFHDQHTSPFEMGKIVFHIKLPIFVMRQFIRHRMQNLNETSARYRALPNEFYIPEIWRVQDKKNRQHTTPATDKIRLAHHRVKDVDGTSYSSDDPSAILLNHCIKAYELYEQMLDAGVGRELARMCLPLNIYTEIVCCWDMKNLINFFRLRLDSHAQLEMQAYALAMSKIAKRRFPWVMEAFERFPVITIDRHNAKV